jgi:4-amino-4-deoxy-L-arabinose transferase-like glycosyltransferase
LWLVVADPLPVSDFSQYLGNARDLIEHGSYGFPEPTAYRLPLYSFMMAGLLLIWDSATWLAFWSVLFSSAICLLVYFVALRVGASNGTALVAALICALFPQFVLFAPVLASEHVLAVLVLTSFLVATSDRLTPWGRIIGAGALTGAAVLTRGDGAIYGLIVLVYAIHTNKESLEGGAVWSARLRQAAAFGIAALLVVSPWIIRNEIVMGPGTALGGNAGHVFWTGHNPQGYGFIPVVDTPLAGLGERELQARAWELGIAYVRENPLSLIASTASGTSELFAPGRQAYGAFWSTRTADRGLRENAASLYPFLVGLSIAGAWFLTIVPLLSLINVRAVGTRLLTLVGSVVFATWFFYSVVFLGNPRYRYLPDVFLSIAAAAVVALIWNARPRDVVHGSHARNSADVRTGGLSQQSEES